MIFGGFTLIERQTRESISNRSNELLWLIKSAYEQKNKEEIVLLAYALISVQYDRSLTIANNKGYDHPDFQQFIYLYNNKIKYVPRKEIEKIKISLGKPCNLPPIKKDCVIWRPKFDT